MSCRSSPQLTINSNRTRTGRLNSGVRGHMIRYSYMFLLVLISSCSTLSAPTTGTYIESGIDGNNSSILVKEHCLGDGIGVVHFRKLDSIKFPRFQIAKINFVSGTRSIHIDYFTTYQTGDIVLTHDFQPNKAYIVRYDRTEQSTFRAWIEPIDSGLASTPNTNCFHKTP
jgi:hypothetical protein